MSKNQPQSAIHCAFFLKDNHYISYPRFNQTFYEISQNSTFTQMNFGSLYFLRSSSVQFMPETQQLLGTALLAVGAQFLACNQSEAFLTPQHLSCKVKTHLGYLSTSNYMTGLHDIVCYLHFSVNSPFGLSVCCWDGKHQWPCLIHSPQHWQPKQIKTGDKIVSYCCAILQILTTAIIIFFSTGDENNKFLHTNFTKEIENCYKDAKTTKVYGTKSHSTLHLYYVSGLNTKYLLL